MRRLGLALLAVSVMAAVALALSQAPAGRSVPSTPSPTRASAVRAAVAALYALSVPAITSRSRFEAQVVRLAAPGAERRVESTFGATEPAVLAAFAEEPRVVRGAPLGYRIERFDGHAASIAIWSVALAASDGFGSESQWRTITVDLAWTSGAWKVTGGRGAAGPGPDTPLRQLAREAAGFRSLVHAP